jgi:hypothetical protein
MGPRFVQSTHATRGWSSACALAAGMMDADGGLVTTCVLSGFHTGIPHELLTR